jgi:hypothetical protein
MWGKRKIGVVAFGCLLVLFAVPGGTLGGSVEALDAGMSAPFVQVNVEVSTTTIAAESDTELSDSGSAGIDVNWYQVVQVLIAAAGVLLVSQQLRQIKRNAKIDFDQRRKESTFEYLVSTQSLRDERSKKIPKSKEKLAAFLNVAMTVESSDPDVGAQENQLGSMSQSGKTGEQIDGKPETNRAAIIKLLNYYERLAAGVNHDVYEFNVVNVVWGGLILGVVDRFAEFMVWYRQQFKKPGLWTELDLLAVRLRAERQQRSENDEDLIG